MNNFNNKPKVTALQVKQLREDTGAGMMDCKKLLERFGGDVEFAKSYMKFVSQAVYIIRGDREKRDMNCAIRELGREPFFDSHNEDYLLNEDQREVLDILDVLQEINREDPTFATKFKDKLNSILND